MSRRRRTRSPKRFSRRNLRRASHGFINPSVRFTLFLSALLLLPTPLLAARLTELSVVPGVVTVIADGPPAVAHQFALSAPDRLVIDLPAVVPAQLSAPGAGSIVAARAAMFSPGVARLVLDLSGPLEIVTARSSATGLTLTLRRISAPAFAELVKRGRKPLPVAPMGSATPAAPADFNLPLDMFASREPTAQPAAALEPAKHRRARRGDADAAMNLILCRYTMIETATTILFALAGIALVGVVVLAVVLLWGRRSND